MGNLRDKRCSQNCRRQEFSQAAGFPTKVLIYAYYTETQSYK